MNIAVLSGKGGTGKTTVSTNLALALNANYVDCDVEEPNGFLFLNPEINKEKNVYVEYPLIDKEKCTSCGKCIDICNFNALAKIKENILVFEKLCHSCMACEIICNFNAISSKKRAIGKVEKGYTDNIVCSRGVLNVGEPMAPPIIKELLFDLEVEDNNIIDCPPGTSCNVINALKYANAAIIVTEPTQFGFHDMKMALEIVKMFNIPFGVIINKDFEEENIIKNYCNKGNIKLIGSIPYSKDIAINYSSGEILYNNPNYKYIFDKLCLKVKEVLKWN